MDVLAVQTGTSMDFPNSDQVRHQVYSFSGAKKFTLALYAGRRAAPGVFDSAGLVTLGCHIRGNMPGYIWVTDSPTSWGEYDIGRLLKALYSVVLLLGGSELARRISRRYYTDFALRRRSGQLR